MVIMCYHLSNSSIYFDCDTWFSQCIPGKLLRKAPQPELMDAIIQASKDGDVAKLQVLSGEETWTIEQDEAEEEDTESDDDEVCYHIADQLLVLQKVLCPL